ncbi:GGDEF domain-containing protein [Halothiobacillus sp.]|uniref:GGDEF domain-containing protein n=1 Tax=Halothiobacillus sp. TaxID=1891311 RepID=UPI00263181FD|nr:GGDEF domain-containing protein [Halothiobacillus sp.]
MLETFNKTVKQQSNAKVELSLLVIDLDFFKRINDLYGHLEGDEVLRIAGSLILKSLPEDAVAFRWGGEEFLAALLGTSLAEARERAEKIRQAFVNREWLPGLKGECVTASIGIAHYPKEASQLIELIAVADKAVYLAKRLGRNRVESHI